MGRPRRSVAGSGSDPAGLASSLASPDFGSNVLPDPSLTDATRWTAEEATIEQDMVLRHAFDESRTDFVMAVDRRGNVRYVTRSIEHVLGFHRDDLTTRSCAGSSTPRIFAPARRHSSGDRR